MSEMLTRAAPQASSVNVERRTVDIVFASETPVRRRDFDGAYDEMLVISREAIDTSRLDAGMSLLDSHRSHSVDSMLGTVLPGSFRIDGGQATATIRFSRKPAAQSVLDDLADGHRLSISVGYKVTSTERVEARKGGVPTIRATRWTPMEISVVAVPADPSASTRSEETMTTEAETIDRQDKNRKLRKTERVDLIRTFSSVLDQEESQELLEATRGMTEMEVRTALFDKLVEREEATPIFSIMNTFPADNRHDEQMQARQDALVARMSGQQPSENARHFMDDSLVDHARGLLEARGVDTRSMSRDEVLGVRGRSYHTTSDFPQLLQGAGERVLQDAYQVAQSPLKTLLARRSTTKDFRAKSRLKISDAGLLEKVNEAGEITHTTRAEAAEAYRIDSYARIFSLTFEAIVNDDLDAFGDWATQAGRMAALTENKVLLDLLLANGGAGPRMGEDNKNLFHADHGNLAAAGSALDEANLAAALLAFRKQRAFGQAASLAGEPPRITVSPRYLLIGPELEVPAQKLLAAISPAKTEDAVPDAIKSLIPVVEPNLDGKAWYIFASPAQQAVFEWSHLTGHEGPQIDTREGFERLGTEFRAVLHFGAGAIDHRGTYRNPGI